VAATAGTTFIGNAGLVDVLAISDAGTVTVGSTASSTQAAISGIERITLFGASTLNVTPSAALLVTTGNGATTVSGTGTGGLITVADGAGNNLVTVDGTSNFAVTGVTAGGVTSTQTGTGATLSTTLADNDATITAPVGVTATVNTGTAGTALTRTVTLAGNADFVVTGLGVTANTVTLTEAAAVRTGTLTVTTVDTVATTITQAASAGSGAFVLNANGDSAGTGTAVVTVVAVAGHASQTINLGTGGTAVTIGSTSTATSYSVNAANSGSHTYINSSTTSSVDTYTGGTGVDNVTTGLGGDVINLGVDTSADIVNIAAGDTAIALGFAHSTAVPTTAITTVGMDVITNFGTQDTIVLTSMNYTSAGAVVRNGGTMLAGSAANTTNTALLLGIYSSTSNTFTPSLTGTDSLFVFDSDGIASAAGTFRGIVLVGYTDPLQNDSVTSANPGIFTPTAG